MSNEISDSAPTIKPPLARITLSDVPDGGAISLDIGFQANRQSVIVTRRGTVTAAFINLCPHARWPLDTFDGRFLFSPDGALICSAHGAIFDPLTGACLGGPGRGQALTGVEFTRDGDDILLSTTPCRDTDL
jgi:nitrite reductase/ring-hydroxylating ferredoxin subunit